MLIGSPVLDDVFEDEYNESVTYYFRTDKKVLEDFGCEIPDGTVWAEISVEVPKNNREAECAIVCISPTVLEGDMYSDVDWTNVDLPNAEIKYLLEIVKEK